MGMKIKVSHIKVKHIKETYKSKKKYIILYIVYDLFARKAHISLNKSYLSSLSARRPSVQVRS